MIKSKIDEEWNIHQPGEVPLNLLTAPFNHFKIDFIEMAQRARSIAHINTRDEHTGLKEVDHVATLRFNHKHTREHQNLLKIVQTGGLWTAEKKLFHLGKTNSKRCPHCQTCDNQTVDHLLWRCSNATLQAARLKADKELAGLDPSALPHSLRFGVAPAMSANPATSYWGSKPAHISRTEQKIVGCHTEHHLHATAHAEIEEQIIALKSQRTQPNARMVFNGIRNANPSAPHSPTNSLIFDSAPKSPNVYSDGSFTDPRSHHFGLMGFGVWWPQRDLTSAPLALTSNT